MPSLMTIAPELRDQVLKEVLFPPEREPPDSPAASQDRVRRVYSGDTTDYHDGHDIWVPRTPLVAPDQHPRAILLVNRQLYHEGSALLARAAGRKTPHRLDVMYVKECGLWPTWLSVVPRAARHIDTLHVQFRIFDPPGDVDPVRRNPRQFVTRNVGGEPLAVWNLFALLSDYIGHGPTAFEPRVGPPCPHTVGKLVLDVAVPPPGTVDDNMGFSRDSPQTVVLEAFAKNDISKHWPRPPRGQTHRMVAEKMAYLVAGKIGALLSMYEDYGAPLYEHIGSIDICVDGQSRRLFDLDELMHIIPTRPFAAHSAKSRAQKQRQFDEWKSKTWAKRRSLGVINPRPVVLTCG
ncbi:hypothetical protein ACRALDRAFT_1060666 [Sodiomyces alcalophilus JCM 7366]|uniref:uncharacterized protein n=1 Tax=Sodiomyces alcalophilus JCM 7366 TaxID=591952 RepID=UPI0039B5FF39